jgi:hypothetical protein
MATRSRSEWKACYSRYPDEIFDRFGNRRATDEKTVAERKWSAPIKPAKPQRPCDHGLFSDEADQLDLCEMFQDQPEDEL